jgi:ABC-type uncharacterized transport system permease subunit
MPPIDRITVFCFAASYAVAFGFEMLFQFRRVPIFRVLSLCFGVAGLVAHTLFVLVQPLLLSSPFGSFIFLGWILSVFYAYGAVHHHRVAWALFVLPLVLGLTLLANFFHVEEGYRDRDFIWRLFSDDDGLRLWGQIHGLLVLLAAVGVCVAFVASVMYLVQAQRLKDKVLPGDGVKMLSLERLETMNRRALTLAFPLLTVGLIVGLALGFNREGELYWQNLKLVSVSGLWLVFAILLYLRYAVHARGRRVAIWTIVAFGLLVLSLASPVHPFVTGGAP